MSGDRVVDAAHELLAPALFDGAVALDATAGRGHDTLWLAQQVGPSGKVWAIDKQAQAISCTRARLADHGLGDRVRLFRLAHQDLPATLTQVAPQTLQAAILNLGYLPGGDKSICTQLEHTQILCDWILSRLAPKGRMVCCVYPGHPEGARESVWIQEKAATLCPKLGSSWIHRLAQRGETCPWIWLVRRASI